MIPNKGLAGLLVLLALVLLAQPALGANITLVSYTSIAEDFQNMGSFSFNSVEYAGGESYVISGIAMEVFPNQNGNFTLTLNSGATIQGWVRHDRSSLGFWEDLSCGLGTETASWSNLASPFASKWFVVAYAIEDRETTDPIYYICLYQSSYFGGGSDEVTSSTPLTVNMPLVGYIDLLNVPTGYTIVDPVLLYEIEGRPSDDPIVQYDLSTTTGISKIRLHLSQIEYLQEREIFYERGSQTFIDWILSVGDSVFAAILLLWGIFSFFFIQHLPLTLLLIEGAILMVSVYQAQNIFDFFELALENNARFIRGIIGMIQAIIEIFTRIIEAIKPV